MVSGEGQCNALGRLTSIDQSHGVIGRFFRVGLEDFRHVWERRFPLERVAEIAMRTHGA